MTQPAFVALGTLAEGARFATESGKVGTLLYANECRARVRWDAAARRVELPDERAFDAPSAPQDVSPGTEVRELRGGAQRDSVGSA